MKNIGQMMKQAQQMQANMAQFQKKLEEMEFEGSAGGGLVRVTMNGKHELKKIKIDPKLMDPAETEMLEDLIVAACNDARAKIEAHVGEETQRMLGGMGLPGGLF
ncbi:MAG: YbaB/EbfC family nucleoid-associated protein [Pseudomonadota bacterium]|nr:YbaB/EbfC family nucleoid-associated protein [Pseudomonadota bacterium]